MTPPEPMLPSEFAEIREALGLNKTQLAHGLGLVLRTISRWEQGEVLIPLHMALLMRMLHSAHDLDRLSGLRKPAKSPKTSP